MKKGSDILAHKHSCLFYLRGNRRAVHAEKQFREFFQNVKLGR